MTVEEIFWFVGEHTNIRVYDYENEVLIGEYNGRDCIDEAYNQSLVRSISHDWNERVLILFI